MLRVHEVCVAPDGSAWLRSLQGPSFAELSLLSNGESNGSSCILLPAPIEVTRWSENDSPLTTPFGSVKLERQEATVGTQNWFVELEITSDLTGVFTLFSDDRNTWRAGPGTKLHRHFLVGDLVRPGKEFVILFFRTGPYELVRIFRWKLPEPRAVGASYQNVAKTISGNLHANAERIGSECGGTFGLRIYFGTAANSLLFVPSEDGWALPDGPKCTWLTESVLTQVAFE